LPSVRIFLISTHAPLRPLIPFLHPGRAAEAMGDLDRALGAYERALMINSQSWAALTMAAHVCRCKEDYGRVSPVSHSPFSASLLARLSPTLGRACVHITLSHFATERSRARPLPLLLLCVPVQPWRRAASETTTTKDCRCLGMCVHVCVSVCLHIFLFLTFDVRSRLVGPRPAPARAVAGRQGDERASERVNG